MQSHFHTPIAFEWTLSQIQALLAEVGKKNIPDLSLGIKQMIAKEISKCHLTSFPLDYLPHIAATDLPLAQTYYNKPEDLFKLSTEHLFLLGIHHIHISELICQTPELLNRLEKKQARKIVRQAVRIKLYPEEAHTRRTYSSSTPLLITDAAEIHEDMTLFIKLNSMHSFEQLFLKLDKNYFDKFKLSQYLILAAQHRSPDIVKFILNQNPSLIYTRDEKRNTLFHYAVMQRSYKLARFLTELEVDITALINSPNSDNLTPLNYYDEFIYTLDARKTDACRRFINWFKYDTGGNRVLYPLIKYLLNIRQDDFILSKNGKEMHPILSRSKTTHPQSLTPLMSLIRDPLFDISLLTLLAQFLDSSYRLTKKKKLSEIFHSPITEKHPPLDLKFSPVTIADPTSKYEFQPLAPPPVALTDEGWEESPSVTSLTEHTNELWGDPLEPDAASIIWKAPAPDSKHSVKPKRKTLSALDKTFLPHEFKGEEKYQTGDYEKYDDDTLLALNLSLMRSSLNDMTLFGGPTRGTPSEEENLFALSQEEKPGTQEIGHSERFFKLKPINPIESLPRPSLLPICDPDAPPPKEDYYFNPFSWSPIK